MREPAGHLHTHKLSEGKRPRQVAHTSANWAIQMPETKTSTTKDQGNVLPNADSAPNANPRLVLTRRPQPIQHAGGGMLWTGQRKAKLPGRIGKPDSSVCVTAHTRDKIVTIYGP